MKRVPEVLKLRKDVGGRAWRLWGRSRKTGVDRDLKDWARQRLQSRLDAGRIMLEGVQQLNCLPLPIPVCRVRLAEDSDQNDDVVFHGNRIHYFWGKDRPQISAPAAALMHLARDVPVQRQMLLAASVGIHSSLTIRSLTDR